VTSPTLRKPQAWEPYNRDEVSRWMRQMPNSFRDWLSREYDLEVQQLRTSSEPSAVYRSQGRLEKLEMIINLRKEA
jgi:hypothetical protein